MSTAVEACLLSVLAASVSPVCAEQLSVRRYSTADGLPGSGVRCIHQDTKGYLWFGTNEGLSRFDGYRFVNYERPDGLGHLWINAITEDRKGRLWVGTNGGGVSRLLDDPREAHALGLAAGRKLISFPVGDSPASNRVNAIAVDADDTLWCATDAGVYRARLVRDDELRFEMVVPIQPGLYGMEAFADSRGRVWFGLPNDVIEVVHNQVVKYGPADDVARHTISAVVEDRQGRTLVANLRGVFEFIEPTGRGTRGQWERVPVTLERDQNIHSMTVDSAGMLWIGTSIGLIKYEDGKQVLYTTAQGLCGNNILAVARDRDGNLWLGTAASGVCKLSGETVVSFTTAEGLPHGVHKIIGDSRGRIYTSTVGAGLTEITDGRALAIPDSRKLPFSTIGWRILQDSRGDWWIGTERGLFRFDGPDLQLQRGTKFAEADGISSAPILAMVKDDRERLWVSSMDGNLYWADLKRRGGLAFGQVRREAISLLRSPLHLMTDPSGTLWLGGQSVLGRLVNGKGVTLQLAAGLPEAEPRAFFVDSRRWFWIGLRNGGASVTKDPTAQHPQFVNYSTATGLASNTVWSITEDNFGRIYLGTGRGLDRLDLKTGRIRHFSTDDGLAGAPVLHCMKDTHGNIWIGTVTGVSKLNPADERASTSPPPVFLSRLQAAGEEESLPETGAVHVPELVLSAARNNLLIEYVGLSFHGSRALRYQYKLETVDSDWSPPTDQRSVTYARLAPGSYRFVVRAITEDGLASAEPAALEFRILPPLWQRWWSLSLVALLICAAALAAHRYRLALALELERVRTRIAADLHDDIGASLSRMAILSEVVTRQAGAIAQDASRMLTEIGDTARGLVDTMSDIVWSIDPTRDDLGSVVARVREFAGEMLDARGIRWEFQGLPDAGHIRLSPDQRRHLFLIFKEAIANITRHAECAHASLRITLTDGALIAEIRDDGRGLPVETGGSLALPAREGHGLPNMRSRAAALGGRLAIESNPGGGTHITMSVPRKFPA